MSLSNLNRIQPADLQIGDDHTHNLLTQALILLGLISLIFAAVPELDLIVTRFFWAPDSGFRFNESMLLTAFRDVNRFLPWIVIGVLLALLIPSPFLRRLKDPPAPHKLLFVLTFFAAGPGLVVHLIKMLVGRARPDKLQEFGGDALFTPPWQLTDQCARHCSFISGEAASAFALLTLVVLLKPKRSRLYVGAIGVLAAAFSMNRVVFGAHFLSDVIIAWSIMYALAVLLWRPFSQNAPQIDAMFPRESRPA